MRRGFLSGTRSQGSQRSQPPAETWEETLHKFLKDDDKRLEQAVRNRGQGLRNFAQVALQRSRRPRVCYVGGSITEQQRGWRVHVHSWLENHPYAKEDPPWHPLACGFHQQKAFMGNVGSSVLCFLVKEWVINSAPDLVFIETAVNDGDTVLESDGDTQAVRRSLEGIVRQIRRELPFCDIVFVYQYLRTDVRPKHRSGTKIWADGLVDRLAVQVYHSVIPQIYETVANHYSVPSINLIELFNLVRAELPPEKGKSERILDNVFRDDCHHTEKGAAFVASVICKALEKFLSSSPLEESPTTPCLHALPSVLDPLMWNGGHVIEISSHHLTFESTNQSTLTTKRRILDRDPLTGKPLHWWLLCPSDEVELKEVTCSGLAILTHVGPDSGWLRCQVKNKRSGDVVHIKKNLFDCWSYYYRLSTVVLFSDAPVDTYDVKIALETQAPDRSISKKDVPPGVDGDLRLWLSYALVMGSEASAGPRSLTAKPKACVSEMVDINNNITLEEKKEAVTVFRHENAEERWKRDVGFGTS